MWKKPSIFIHNTDFPIIRCFILWSWLSALNLYFFVTFLTVEPDIFEFGRIGNNLGQLLPCGSFIEEPAVQAQHSQIIGPYKRQHAIRLRTVQLVVIEVQAGYGSEAVQDLDKKF